MNVLFAAMILTAAPEAARVEACPSHDQMIEQLSAEAQTGTLLFSQGDCMAVKVFSGSPYTHVAAVVIEEDQPYVYDSMNGAGVRKQTLADYIRSAAPDEVHVLQPKFRYSSKLRQPYTAHLREEIGRPYAVKHHLTGDRCEGIHCAEYVTDALMASDIIRAKNPPKVSPASLLEGITKASLYRESLTLNLDIPPPPRKVGDTWCERLWLDTKYCTMDCWDSFNRKVLCR